MWKQLLESLTDKCEFSPPFLGDFARAETILGALLPADLQSLMRESNGVRGEYESGLVWSMERIVETNGEMRQNSFYRELYMPFEPLLFFADAGTGDLFAFPVVNGAPSRRDIFAWNHEDDSRIWVAPSLEKYLEWWLNGKIKL